MKSKTQVNDMKIKVGFRSPESLGWPIAIEFRPLSYVVVRWLLIISSWKLLSQILLNEIWCISWIIGTAIHKFNGSYLSQKCLKVTIKNAKNDQFWNSFSLLLHIKNLLHSNVYQEALYQNSKFISPGVGLLNPGRDQSGHKQLI